MRDENSFFEIRFPNVSSDDELDQFQYEDMDRTYRYEITPMTYRSRDAIQSDMCLGKCVTPDATKTEYFILTSGSSADYLMTRYIPTAKVFSESGALVRIPSSEADISNDGDTARSFGLELVRNLRHAGEYTERVIALHKPV